MGFVLAASVSRNVPSRVDPGSEVTVTLSMSGANAGEGTAIEDTIPSNIKIKSWDISGTEEAKDAVSYVTKPSKKEGFTRHSWSFTAAGSPSITYKFDAPSTEGGLAFDVRWVTSDGFSHQESTLDVRAVRCGDGRCEGSENSDNCVADCPKPPPPAPTTTPTETPTTPEAPSASNTMWVILAVVAIIIIGALVYKGQAKKKPAEKKE